MRAQRAGRDRDLSADDLITVDAAQQQADVVTGQGLRDVLVELLDARDDHCATLMLVAPGQLHVIAAAEGARARPGR